MMQLTMSPTVSKTVLIDMPAEGGICASPRNKLLEGTSAHNDVNSPTKSSSDTITTARASSEDGETACGASLSLRSRRQPSWTHSSCSHRDRKVRFQTDDQDQVLTTVLATSPSDNLNDVWLSPHEMDHIHEHTFAVVDFFARYRMDYTDAVRSMIASCAQADASQYCLQTSDKLPEIVGSSARGLEHCIVEVIRHRRNGTRQQLLDLQSRLRSLNRDKRSHLLALQYVQNSRYAALWAQLLADLDALEVADSWSSHPGTATLSQSCHH